MADICYNQSIPLRKKGTLAIEDLKEYFSDLLFRVQINNKDSYIYLLFEHKSYRDKLVIFQVLRYMLQIWERKIELNNTNKKKESKVTMEGNIEIPIILPVVIYHDKAKWTVKRTLGELIFGYDDLPDGLKLYILNFKYLLFDLSQWPEQAVRLNAMTLVGLKVLSKTRYATSSEMDDLIFEVVELTGRLNKQETITSFVSACIRYILSVRDDISEIEMKEIAERVSVEGGELVMSTAERLMREGMEKERIRMVKNLLKINLPLEQIITATGLTKGEIEEIKSKE